MMVNKTLYGLHLRNRNVFGNTTVHNITFAVFQNGSRAMPMEAKLRGHLELMEEMKRGLAIFQVDEKALSVGFSSIMSHGHSRVSGTFAHNISLLKNAGMKKTDLMLWCHKVSGVIYLSECRPVEIDVLRSHQNKT